MNHQALLKILLFIGLTPALAYSQSGGLRPDTPAQIVNLYRSISAVTLTTGYVVNQGHIFIFSVPNFSDTPNGISSEINKVVNSLYSRFEVIEAQMTEQKDSTGVTMFYGYEVKYRKRGQVIPGGLPPDVISQALNLKSRICANYGWDNSTVSPVLVDSHPNAGDMNYAWKAFNQSEHNLDNNGYEILESSVFQNRGTWGYTIKYQKSALGTCMIN